MQHLFLGIDPTPLGHKPFTGLVAEEVRAGADELPLSVSPSAQHVFMPLIGGYVGADTMACLIELPRDDRPRLLIDLGTNCEVAVKQGPRTLVASTACGPALEGAGISTGMRAAEGAVERVSCEDGELVYSVIGGVDPVGLCGSGIIDLVAVLLEQGAITKKGAFVKGEALERHPWRDRIVTGEDGARRFVLLPAADNPAGVEISLSLKDIRAIQLAKSAIFAGCTTLVRLFGIEMADLEEICLAGAFGNYIDVNNAQAIGLVPHADGVSVRSIGNGAGRGVQRYLLSCDERSYAEQTRRGATHIELADDETFTETYLGGMRFGINSCMDAVAGVSHASA